MQRFVVVKKFSEMTGYTPNAVHLKVRDGVWAEGLEYRRAPDGRILIDLEGFNRWVEAGKGAASAPSQKASKSGSHGTESDAAKT